MQDSTTVATVDAGEINEHLAAIYTILGGICSVAAERDPEFLDNLKKLMEIRIESEGRPTARNMMRSFVQVLGEPVQLPTLSVIPGGKDDR